MFITFISNIVQNEKSNKIKFKAPVKTSTFNEYSVFEFEEPQNKVMNRIEINDKRVNIFAGSTSINLELGNIVDIMYQTTAGPLVLKSYLRFLEIKEEHIRFEYTLAQNNELIGSYEINLLITKT